MAKAHNRRSSPPRLKRGNDSIRHIQEMRAAFPGFSYQLGRDQSVTWRGEFQPNPSSDSYRLKVVYGRWGPPKVFVVNPCLPLNAPHRWPDKSLCLYWHREWWWSDSESISQTIMPWTALWLEYYEIWKVIGTWLGPSSHEEFPVSNHDARTN